jgi:hypothetical protein
MPTGNNNSKNKNICGGPANPKDDNFLEIVPS